MDLDTSQPVEDGGELEMMSAAEWMETADTTPERMLLGSLWREGEISVLFGETSVGKSILAVQIAEAVARGEAFAPFERTAEAQKVLLVDLGGTATQFTRRYTSEPDDNGPGKPYEFSENLLRVSLKNSVQISPIKLGPLIERSGAKVLIIDSLAFLQKYAVPRETVVVMRELRRLQKRFGLSILVVMTSSRTIHSRGIQASDIPCSGVVTSFADNVFAVGRSGSRSRVRYVKHIKNTMHDTVYNSAHLPYFMIAAWGGNFPMFYSLGVASEETLRTRDNDYFEWQRVREIQRLTQEKKSIREIAAELNMARSTVHRLLEMAAHAPPLPPTASATVSHHVRQFFVHESCILSGCTGCGGCKGRPATNFKDIPGTLIKGHGADCEDDCDMCGPRQYDPDDTTADPVLKQRSKDHFAALRAWIYADKNGPRPIYPGARRYGHEKACWKPGSENWTDEQRHIYDRWIRTCQRGPEPNFNPP